MIGKSPARSQFRKENLGEVCPADAKKRKKPSSVRLDMPLGSIVLISILLPVFALDLIAQQSTQSNTTYVKTRPSTETGPCRSTVKINSYTRTGLREATFIEPGIYCQIELAPDDKHLVLERKNEYAGGPVGLLSFDLLLADFQSRTLAPWVSVPASYPRDPVWSPDSKRIGYRVWVDQQRCELRINTLGSESAEVIAENSKTTFSDDWTPDGKFLLYHTDEPDTVALQPVTPGQQSTTILEEPGGRNSMRVSPDGQWIAYGSNESGNWEVYVAAYPSFKGKRCVTQGGGVQVRWRRDSKEYFYLDPSSRMIAQGFDPATGKEIGEPRFLFQTSLPPAFQVYFYAVNSDGTKFFLVEAEDDTASKK